MTNNIVEDYSTKLDFVKMMMVNDERLTYFYDSIDRLEYEISELWIPAINNWENDERLDYSYDSSHNTILIETRAYNDVAMEWRSPYRQTILDYNENNMPIEVTEQVISSGSYVNTAKVINTYGTNNNVLEILGLEWNSSTSSWDNSYRQLNNFDANNNEIELIYETWNTSTNQWEAFLRLVKYWSEAESLNVDDAISQLYKITIYPNPVIDDFTLKGKTLLMTPIHAVLFDVYGNKVDKITTDDGKSEFKLSLKKRSAGIYFLRLNNQRVFKIVKQ